MPVQYSGTNQHRRFRVCQYLVGHAAEQQRGQATSPVRGHDDEIAALVLGRCDDGLIGMLVRKMPGVKASRYSFDVKPLGPGKAPYFCIFEAEFEDETGLMSALGSKEGQAVAGDVANYASGGVNNGLRPGRLVPYFIGRAGSAAELSALHDYQGTQRVSEVGKANYRAELVALVLASPAFQRC